MKKQKQISTLVGMAIIFIAAVILFGGVFVLQYFIAKNINQNSNQQQALNNACSIIKKGVDGSDEIIHSDYNGGIDIVLTDYNLITEYEFAYTKIKIVKNNKTISEITPYDGERFEGFDSFDSHGYNISGCSSNARFIKFNTFYSAVLNSCVVDGNINDSSCVYLKYNDEKGVRNFFLVYLFFFLLFLN